MNMSKAFLFIIILLGSLFFQLKAQEDLTKDAPFFRKQVKVYQRWLDHSGMGDYLSVYGISAQSEKLTLFLEFPFTDIDSVAATWSMLRESHFAQSSISLEEQLLYKASFIMEVDTDMMVVEVRNTYEYGEKAFFERELTSKSGELCIEESNPKSKTRDIDLAPADIHNMRGVQVASFQDRYSRQVVYDSILRYAKGRYEQEKCIHRYPKVRVLENKKDLVFEVTDLCREVLVDETNPILCRIMRSFGRNCNWVKREMLRFRIRHENTAEGFTVKIILDGKYGSGFYEKVKRGGYLDMEIDFDEYLEDYANEFSTTLRNTFVNSKPQP